MLFQNTGFFLLLSAINLEIQAQTTTINSCTENQEKMGACLIQQLQNRIDLQDTLIEGLLSTNDPMKRRDCFDLRIQGFTSSQIYDIFVEHEDQVIPIKVFCDMKTDGGGWTVLQNRQDASVGFNRTWEDFKHGFGYLYANHWLGNLFAHSITSSSTYAYMLRIDLSDWDDNERHAVYSGFRIGSEQDNFGLRFDAYLEDLSNVADSLTRHNGMGFTTYDQDNDRVDYNCAQVNGGGFWHNNCQTAGLNNFYSDSSSGFGNTGSDKIRWDAWHGSTYSLKTTKMMIRPEN